MIKKTFSIFLLSVILLSASYYQFFVKPDVLHTSHISEDGAVSENIGVSLNEFFVLNKGTTANRLLEMRLSNSFQSMMFSAVSPEEIRFIVYLNPLFKQEAFSFYFTRKKDGTYEVEMEEP